MHKRRRHVPEERYTIDGRLIQNEASVKQKPWDLKALVNYTVLLVFYPLTLNRP